MIGLAIDARYHGERAGGAQGATAYVAAITAAWKTKPGEPQEHPFYFDTVWDLWRLLDYVGQRPDVDPQRVAMVGFSMGGIQTWLAAAVDQRVARGRARDQRAELSLEPGARPLARPRGHDHGRAPRKPPATWASPKSISASAACSGTSSSPASSTSSTARA